MRGCVPVRAPWVRLAKRNLTSSLKPLQKSGWLSLLDANIAGNDNGHSLTIMRRGVLRRESEIAGRVAQ